VNSCNSVLGEIKILKKLVELLLVSSGTRQVRVFLSNYFLFCLVIDYFDFSFVIFARCGRQDYDLFIFEGSFKCVSRVRHLIQRPLVLKTL